MPVSEDSPDRRASYIQGAIRGTLTYLERALAAPERARADGEIRQARGRVRATETHVLALRALLGEELDIPPFDKQPPEPEPPVEDPPPVEPEPPVELQDRPILLPSEIAVGAGRGADQTAAIQAWIEEAADGSTLVFQPGVYQIDGGLTLKNRSGLTIEGNGATFRTAYSTQRDRAHWRFKGGSDITLRKMTCVGAHPNGGQDGDYNAAIEAQHAYVFGGTQRVLLEDLRATDTYGDGVYLGAAEIPVRNVTIRRLHCERTGRHGIAITNAERIVVEDSYMGEIRWSGIDIEPNGDFALSQNIVFRRNRFGPVRHYLLVVGGNGLPTGVGDITFADNVHEDRGTQCLASVKVRAENPDSYRRNIAVTGNRLLCGRVELGRVRGFEVTGNQVLGDQRNLRLELGNSHDGRVAGDVDVVQDEVSSGIEVVP